jgi:hypothetical protein
MGQVDFFAKLFSRAANFLKSVSGFAGCGKTRPEQQEVSGHDFSRAVSAANE